MSTGEKPTGSIKPLWKIKLQDLRSDVEKKIPDGIDDNEKETIIKSTRDILTDMKKDLGVNTASPYYTQLKDLLETVKKHRTQKPTPTTEPESNAGTISPEKTVIRNSVGTELLPRTLNMLKKNEGKCTNNIRSYGGQSERSGL